MPWKPCIRALRIHTIYIWAWASVWAIERTEKHKQWIFIYIMDAHDLWSSEWSNTYSGWIERLWNIKKQNKRSMRLSINKPFFFIPVPVVGAVPGRAPQLNWPKPCKVYVFSKGLHEHFIGFWNQIWQWHCRHRHRYIHISYDLSINI